MPESVLAVLWGVAFVVGAGLGTVRLFSRESRAALRAWRPSRTLMVLSWILGLLVAGMALPYVPGLYAVAGLLIASIFAVMGLAGIVVPAIMTWRGLRQDGSGES